MMIVTVIITLFHGKCILCMSVYRNFIHLIGISFLNTNTISQLNEPFSIHTFNAYNFGNKGKRNNK